MQLGRIPLSRITLRSASKNQIVSFQSFPPPERSRFVARLTSFARWRSNSDQAGAGACSSFLFRRPPHRSSGDPYFDPSAVSWTYEIRWKGARWRPVERGLPRVSPHDGQFVCCKDEAREREKERKREREREREKFEAPFHPSGPPSLPTFGHPLFPPSSYVPNEAARWIDSPSRECASFFSLSLSLSPRPFFSFILLSLLFLLAPSRPRRFLLSFSLLRVRDRTGAPSSGLSNLCAKTKNSFSPLSFRERSPGPFPGIVYVSKFVSCRETG